MFETKSLSNARLAHLKDKQMKIKQDDRSKRKDNLRDFLESFKAIKLVFT